MSEIFSQIQVEQLLTAGGFVAFLIWQNMSKEKRIEKLETDHKELTERYIKTVQESNKDLLEATRTFDRLLQSRGQ